ncbi:MAG: bluetail domain-containing putative surface protein, partial [Snowella sp.]
IGTDKIDLLTSTGLATPAPTSFSRATNSAAADLTTVVNNVFTDANGAIPGNQALAINSAALVQVTTAAIVETYLVINNGTAGFQNSILGGNNDSIVNITGFTGTVPALGTISVNSFFV